MKSKKVSSESEEVINSSVDPSNLIDKSADRILYVNNLTKEFTQKLINAEVKRIDDLMAAHILKLDSNLADHKEYNEKINEMIAIHSREINSERDSKLQAKFSSMEMAITKAENATERRFEGVNEFRNTLSDQQKLFMPRAEYTNAHSSLSQMLTAIEKRVDKAENVKQGAGLIWAYILGAVGLITGLITFLTKTLG